MARVGILATGDEIINGDILNSNGQRIATQLLDAGIQPGMQAVASDSQTDLEAGMQFLLQHHEVLITIGGLGPTSDDRTRFALAEVVQLPLVLDQAAWQRIEDRLHQYKLAIPESNKQQAYFPEGATVLENQHGTASACKLVHQDKLIYMLPGPPNECLPIFNQQVLPDLQQHFANNIYRKSWLLLGVSEGSIAEQLDIFADNNDVSLGYRVSYPYLEVKLLSSNQAALNQLADSIEPIISDKVVSLRREHASDQLKQWLETQHTLMSIHDQATGGRLQSALLTPFTQRAINFSDDNNADIVIEGLSELWQQSDTDHTTVKLSIKHHTEELKIPYRGERTLAYAVENICWHILQTLRKTL